MTLSPDNHTLILAPMADLTHAGFRLLVEHYGGCDLYYSEMIDARLYLTGGPMEKYYESTLPHNERLIFQLVGANGEELFQAAERLVRFDPLGIDINMGCSAPYIIATGAGCALMRDREKALHIMGHMRKILPQKMKLSAKIRLGEKNDGEALVHFARGLEEAGADFIVLHPKTRREKAARRPQRDFIGLLQRELTIPVIANGHIWTPESYLSCWKNQKPSGIMLGRQAVRQPWFFNRLRAMIEAKEGSTPLKTLTKIDLEECWQIFYENLMIHQPLEFHKSRAWRFSSFFHENLLFGHNLHFSRVTNSTSSGEIDRLYKQYFREHREECFFQYPES
jgi:tRNA-dihydrouridine synthase B